MIRLTRRALRSRAAGKFRRNRLAVVALGVIMVYVLVGVAGFVGIIRGVDALERVGPDSVLGWLEQQPVEKRLRDCKFYRELAERTLRRSDYEAAVRETALFERGLVLMPKADLTKALKAAETLYNSVADSIDDEANARLDAKKYQPGAAAADAARHGDAVAKAEKSHADATSSLSELETATSALYPIPDGWRGTVYTFRTFLGTDRQGRSISMRALYSVRIALQVGLVVATAALVIGTLLGGAAAFFGGWVDHVVTWLYSTFSSIPELVLLSLLAYVFLGKNFVDELIPVYAALSLTFWIGPCRIIRGEVMKIRELEYVQAATAIGFRRGYIMLRHVLPNTSHLMLINFSLLFIAAIKAEVILTFLGLGVKNGASWGIMIGQSRQEVINGNFWQIGVATALMFVLVLAFNIVSDALQDAFDPKHVG